MRLGVWLLAAAIVVFPAVAAPPDKAAAQAKFTEEGGHLPDGTEYLMRVPSNWNGTLIRDLDYASGSNSPRWAALLEKGYALAGTGRHRLRLYQYDPVREIANLDRVLGLFATRFGRPKRVIQHGCSGGGAVGLFIAEDFSNGIDGVIASAAHIPVWQMNTFLDGWFVLKALIAPDLPIVDLPVQASGGTDHGTEGDLPEAWRRAINAAQQTPEGQARIALAFTLGQWPAWAGHRLTPQPELDNTAELQHSMYHTLFHNAENPGGEARIRKELAANGQQLSWNTGIDYREFFENGNESFKRAVRQLYREAGLDLDADLGRINAFPRVSASPYALEWWNTPGRTAKGTPKIPLLRMHEVGDQQVPLSLVQGYGDLVRANGKDDLYRLAVVNSPAHCNYTAAETMAAVETMMRRLDTGQWGSTDPEQLNTLGKSLHGSAARFTHINRYAQKKYNRTWSPGSPAAPPAGRAVAATGARQEATRMLPALSDGAAAQTKVTEEGGKLPDGTEYLMRVPANWNGTVIRDLDYASNAGSRDSWRNYSYLIGRGYALIGTGRHPLRALRYDPAVEIANLDRVLDMFDKRFRRPDRVIQFGCSGGGAVTLSVAEDFSSRIDGAVAMAAHIPVWQMNTFLDGWFTLKALIAPDLPVVDLPFDASGRIRPDIPEAWRRAINAAQQTPEGRARIALAFTLGQWPAWVNGLTPQPRLEDAAELQHSMYHAVFQTATDPGGNSRIRKELAALGQQLSWNTGIDYREFFENGNESFKHAVRQLYQEAGLHLEADLARVNAFPRVSASPYALEWWNAPGRTAKGDPKIPLLRIHEIGDPSIPPSLVQGYDDLVRANRRDDLYRTAYVQAASHCGFTAAEAMAAIETMMRRLDTGRWASTDPAQMNTLAKSLHGSAARFTRIDRYAQKKYNRTWAPAGRPPTLP
jgi:uncharacterized protein YjeT (DUF2065 family)